MERVKFRRATHKNGVYNTKFREDNLTGFQKRVWEKHGDICHMLDSDKGMEFDDIFDEIRKDTTNYIYAPEDLDGWRDGSMLPTVAEVAIALVRLLEAGFVELEVPTEPEKKYDYLLYLSGTLCMPLFKSNREEVASYVKGYRETSHENDYINVEEFEMGRSKGDKPRDTFYL